jgi:putative ABC transport system substrate-binding protein
MPVIGFLRAETPNLWANYVRAFQQGLRETGYVEDHNLPVEYRWAEGQSERLSVLVNDLVRRRSHAPPVGLMTFALQE